MSKYSELLSSGFLVKLKTREKKFKPIADHVNSVHHLQDPVNFPFKWSWRDVSIKVQNMRHQYLGVKQKIRVSKDEFNWKDGENHWENFLKYKEVFGDVDLDAKDKRLGEDVSIFDLGFGIDYRVLNENDDHDDDEEDDESDDLAEDAASDGEFRGERGIDEMGLVQPKKLKKGFDFGGVCGRGRSLGLVSAQVLEFRDVMMKREDRRREREFIREKGVVEIEEERREAEMRKENCQSTREEELNNREMELEERQMMWARREYERRLRLERELAKERWRRMKLEEMREEEEMKWRERMVGLQIEHEKAMMQMHADACQNQMQILGVMARLVCQYFGTANDGLGAGLGALPSQVLESLHHSGGLGDHEKPDANSPSEFI